MKKVNSAILYCDGAARGNPGPAASGYVLLSDNTEIARGGSYLGEASNNTAEYEGLIQGLTKAVEIGIGSLTVRSDSELLVRQLNGQYRVRAPHLKPLFQKAVKLLEQFKLFTVEHIPREENGVADKICNEILDRRGM